MNALLGIDLGTQGTKAALFDEEGRCHGQASFETTPIYFSEGHVEEDPTKQLDMVCNSVKRCMQDAGASPGSVKALAIAGQMAGIIGIDETGRHVTPYDSWLDTRCSKQVQQMRESVGDRVTKLTGCAPSFNHGPKMLWWKHEQPYVYQRIASFVQPASYVAMQFCGLSASQAFIDTSYLHFTGLADNINKSWDHGLCEAIELDPAKLPKIVEPSTVIGELQPELASRCGLDAGTAVVAGCGDSAASFLASGAASPGVSVDVSGTASVFAATTKHFLPDLETHTLGCGRSTIDGLWHPYAYINGGGLNIEWFRKNVMRGPSLDNKSGDFESLEALVQSVTPHEDLPFFVPHFGGRVSPNQPSIRGAWANLSWETGLSELYYAVLESVVLEYAIYNNQLERLDPNAVVREMRVTGGGQKSKYWNQLKSDLLGIPVQTIRNSQGAPLGAAMIAGQGVGLVKALASAAEDWSELGDSFEPRQSMCGLLQARLSRYEQLLQSLDAV